MTVFPCVFSTSKPAKLANPAATMSHAVMASSGSKSPGGRGRGRCTKGALCCEAASKFGLRNGPSVAWLEPRCRLCPPVHRGQCRGRGEPNRPVVDDEGWNARQRRFFDEGFGHHGLARTGGTEHGAVACENLWSDVNGFTGVPSRSQKHPLWFVLTFTGDERPTPSWQSQGRCR